MTRKNIENLINWKELSRVLAGNKECIRRNKIPKIYKDKVNELFAILDFWHSELKNDSKNIYF